MHFLSVMALAAIHAAPVGATPITSPDDLVGPQTVIDFNSLSPGSITSPIVLSGVTFSGNLSAIDTDLFGASTSFPTFVSSMALGLADGDPSPPNYTIAFASPVAQVGFGLFDPNFFGNAINAYNSGGDLLETTSPDALFPPGGSGADYLGFVRGSADIARIEIVAAFGGASGTVLDALWVDNLSFSSTPVPAPSTLLLISVGLLGLHCQRRSPAKMPNG
jgi:hypothetical protein